SRAGHAPRRPRRGARVDPLRRHAPPRGARARRSRDEGVVHPGRPRHVRRAHRRRRREARAGVVLARRLGARALRGALHDGRARDLVRALEPPACLIALSRVGLGTNNFGRRLDLERSRAVVEAALAAGVTHLDTADIYGGGDSERFIGEIVEGRRHAAFIATKFGMGAGGNGSPSYVRRAIDASLERLRTDHVDLLYYHRPDRVTPIAETVGAMQKLADLGKVRYLGVSNVDAAQLQEAVATAPIAAVQNRYSLLDRAAERDMLPLCAELGVGF